MFKILTIFALFYFTSSALPDAITNQIVRKAENNRHPIDSGSTYDASSNNKRDKRNTEFCSNQNKQVDPEIQSLRSENYEDNKPKPSYIDLVHKAYDEEHSSSIKPEVSIEENENLPLLPSLTRIELTEQNPQQRTFESSYDVTKDESSKSEPKPDRAYQEAKKASDADTQQILYERKDNSDSSENELGSSQNIEPVNQLPVEPKVQQECLSLVPGATRRRNNYPDEAVLSLSNDNEIENTNNVESVEKTYRKHNAPHFRHRNLGYYNTQLGDPAKGPSVSVVSNSRVNLLEYNRVCYACSSISNPTCAHPDRRTTIKYCLKGHESCVTKTYHAGFNQNTSIVIRDCGVSCIDTDIPGPEYKSCKVCNTDICNDEPFNGAFSVNSQSAIFGIIAVFVVKFIV